MMATVEGGGTVPVDVALVSDVVRIESLRLRRGEVEGAAGAFILDVSFWILWDEVDPRARLDSHLDVAIDMGNGERRTIDGSDNSDIGLFKKPWDVCFLWGSPETPKRIVIKGYVKRI